MFLTISPLPTESSTYFVVKNIVPFEVHLVRCLGWLSGGSLCHLTKKGGLDARCFKNKK
jgi:hypothetical protein